MFIWRGGCLVSLPPWLAPIVMEIFGVVRLHHLVEVHAAAAVPRTRHAMVVVPAVHILAHLVQPCAQILHIFLHSLVLFVGRHMALHFLLQEFGLCCS